MKRRLVVDVDGPVALFTDHLLQTVGSRLTEADVRQWQVFDVMEPIEKEAALVVLNSSAWWESIPVRPGAIEAIAHLEHYFEIFWATSPWWSCIGWEHARRGWLQKHFGAEKKDMASISNKSFLGGDAFVDDKPAHVEGWALQNPQGQAVLFGLPHNRGHFEPHRVEGWTAVIERLMSDRVCGHRMTLDGIPEVCMLHPQAERRAHA